MMTTSIADRVKKLIVDHYAAAPASVTDGAVLMEDFGGDSIDAIEIVMAVEEEFEVEIPDAALDGLVTVGDLVAWLGQAGAR